ANGEWALARKLIAEPMLAALIPSPAFPFFMPHFVFPTLGSLPTLNSIAITPDSKQLAASLFFSLPGYYRAPSTIALWNLPGYYCAPSTIALWNLADGTRTSRFE